MTDKTNMKWGWILLIMICAISFPVPPVLVVAGFIMYGFRIPRCFWNWFYISVLGKEKIVMGKGGKYN